MSRTPASPSATLPSTLARDACSTLRRFVCLLNIVAGSENNYASGSVEDVLRPPKNEQDLNSLSSHLLNTFIGPSRRCASSSTSQAAKNPAMRAPTGRSLLAADSSGLAQQQQEECCCGGGWACSRAVIRGIPRSGQRREKLAVLLRVKALKYTRQTRASIDLVVVLDIGGRTVNELTPLNQGAKFIIHNLTQDDRLSIFTFGPRADQPFELMSMSEQGKWSAKRGGPSLEASGGVKIVQGLKEAYQENVNVGKSSSSITDKKGDFCDEGNGEASEKARICRVHMS